MRKKENGRRRCLQTVVFCAALMFFPAHVAKAEAFSRTVHGSVTNETAFRTSEPHEFTKIKNIVRLSTAQPLSSHVTLNLAGRFSYDAVYTFTDTYGDQVKKDQESEADLREAFFHLSLGDWDVRLGRQQIVWGEAVGGLFVADVVTPKDLREFILPEPSEIRIPLWAANVEYFLRGTYLQLVWVPVPDFNELPVEGSEFEQPLRLPQGVPVTIRSADEPARNVKNSALGWRVSRKSDRWDLGAFYLYTFDFFPAPVLRVQTLEENRPALLIAPEYRRLHLFGTTFSTSLGDDILRGEFVLNKGKEFATDDPAHRDGLAKKDVLDYLLSFDHTFAGKVDCNIQWLQRILIDPEPSIRERKIKSFGSLWLETAFWNNRLEPEIFLIIGFNQTDIMVRPKITYHWTEHWQVALGADVFDGSSDGDFGRFDTKDRVYIEVGFHF